MTWTLEYDESSTRKKVFCLHIIVIGDEAEFYLWLYVIAFLLQLNWY